MKKIVAVMLAGAMALVFGGQSSAQAPPVQAFPAPGTTAAQRGTEISLRGVAPDAVGTVVVTGSRSGEHAGRLLAHSDGLGASFVPDGAFRPGERVTVRTDLNVRGGEDGDYRFTVLRGEFETGRDGSDDRVPPARRGTYTAYRSDPNLRTPRLIVDQRRAGRAPGYLVMNTGWDDARPRPEGVLIASDDGEPVFFQRRTAKRKLFDVSVQEYEGNQVLTYWEGRFAAGWGYGDYVMLDSSYREIARISALGGYRADIHDMQITPEGTALVLVYNRVGATCGRGAAVATARSSTTSSRRSTSRPGGSCSSGTAATTSSSARAATGPRAPTPGTTSTSTPSTWRRTATSSSPPATPAPCTSSTAGAGRCTGRWVAVAATSRSIAARASAASTTRAGSPATS